MCVQWCLSTHVHIDAFPWCWKDKKKGSAFMCYVFHRSSWSLLHCPCSPTGPGGPGRPGLPGGPSIPFGPGIPGVPVKHRYFNQIMNKTDFSADLEKLQSETPWVTNELILPKHCIYAHFADLQLVKEMNYKAKNVQKRTILVQMPLLLLSSLFLIVECPWPSIQQLWQSARKLLF